MSRLGRTVGGEARPSHLDIIGDPGKSRPNIKHPRVEQLKGRSTRGDQQLLSLVGLHTMLAHIESLLLFFRRDSK
jgi:hypothetical protein